MPAAWYETVVRDTEIDKTLDLLVKEVDRQLLDRLVVRHSENLST